MPAYLEVRITSIVLPLLQTNKEEGFATVSANCPLTPPPQFRRSYVQARLHTRTYNRQSSGCASCNSGGGGRRFMTLETCTL